MAFEILKIEVEARKSMNNSRNPFSLLNHEADIFQCLRLRGRITLWLRRTAGATIFLAI